MKKMCVGILLPRKYSLGSYKEKQNSAHDITFFQKIMSTICKKYDMLPAISIGICTA